ncbi:hypothetical protein NEOLEDRAFT_1021632, partial [Neolentinus lepideus HHB14362 ss-1]
LQPLVSDMMQETPNKWPNMEVVLNQFGEICRTLPTSKLHSRVVPHDEDTMNRFFKSVGHWYWHAGCVV